MHSFMRAFFTLCASGILLAAPAFAQDSTIHTGFAIVTLESGNVAGLFGTETLINQTASGTEQTVVAPSPLVTTASLLVHIGSGTEDTTALALANPSSGSGGVNLILTDTLGSVVLNNVINLGPFGQVSKFISDLFPIQPPPAFTTPLLLTISSEIPIGILALDFRGTDFAALPLTSLTTPFPVPVQPVNPILPTTPLTPTATTVPSTTGVFPGFGLGVATPIVPIPIVPTTVPTTVTNQTLTPTTATIGGASSLMFTQVAFGGGWSSTIAVANTSSGLQTVRIDFFGANGLSINSLTNIVIQPLGVFVFSTDAFGAAR
jgi:hypothetical protein